MDPWKPKLRIHVGAQMQSSQKLTSPTPEASNFWHGLVEFASEVARLASKYKRKENNW